MNWWQILLFPFAIIYDLVTRIRNWLYDIGLKKVHTFPDLKIISVGNLSLGGTGKTPMVEFLIRYGIDRGWKMATLSRGYGRKTKGALIAKTGDTSLELGDESYGYFDQFGEKLVVAVAERRVEGVKLIKLNSPEVEFILLDDAFQHRSVKPDLSFLLTTSQKPFWKDFVVPSGRLRESSNGYRRADMLVVTKSNDRMEVPYSIPSAFSSIEYDELKLISGTKKDAVIGLAGLANPEDFFTHVSAQFEVADFIKMNDHHDYSEEEIRNIIERCNNENAMLITTYKDAVKLKELKVMERLTWGYIPIAMTFIDGKDEVITRLDSLDKNG